ncbi:hypothetical protein, partial [Kitasatospora sp. NPDC001175]
QPRLPQSRRIRDRPGGLTTTPTVSVKAEQAQASNWEYGPEGQVEWTRRPGGRCWSCHEKHQQRQEEEREAKARAQLEAARAASAALRPCWTCRGSIGGKAGSKLELTEKASPDRLECP